MKQREQIRLEVPLEQRPRKAPTVRAATPRQKQLKLRPTGLMDRISAFLAANPDEAHTPAAINRSVVGASEAIGRALSVLVEEGYATVTVGGVDARGRTNRRRRAYRHARLYSVASEPPDPASVTVVATQPTRPSTAVA